MLIQDELNNFLSVAEELAVKGLTSNETAGVSNKFNGKTDWISVKQYLIYFFLHIIKI